MLKKTRYIFVAKLLFFLTLLASYILLGKHSDVFQVIFVTSGLVFMFGLLSDLLYLIKVRAAIKLVLSKLIIEVLLLPVMAIVILFDEKAPFGLYNLALIFFMLFLSFFSILEMKITTSVSTQNDTKGDQYRQ